MFIFVRKEDGEIIPLSLVERECLAIGVFLLATSKSINKLFLYCFNFINSNREMLSLFFFISSTTSYSICYDIIKGFRN